MDTNLFNELMKAVAANKGGGATIDMATVMLILGALAPTITALAAYFKAKAVQAEVKDVHLSINSRLDGWLEKARVDGVMGERKSVADAADAAAKEISKPK